MNDEPENFIQLHPAWRQAVADFLAGNFQPGHVLEFGWLYEHFTLAAPTGNTTLDVADKTQLQFLRAFNEFQDALLTEHQVALANVRGVGYRVVHPGEQTQWAEGEGIAEIKRAARKLGSRLTNVNLSLVDATKRRENADALARLSMLSGTVRRIAKHETAGDE